jgi:hypothetical protein
MNRPDLPVMRGPAGPLKHGADISQVRQRQTHDLGVKGAVSRLRRRLAVDCTACVDQSPRGSLVHLWFTRSPASNYQLGTGLSRLADHCICRSKAVCLALDDRHRPSQTVASGTRRAQCTYKTIWMQTIGTTQVAVEWCSLVRMWMPDQGSRSAHGLLYLAAVWDGERDRESCQRMLDTDRRDDQFRPSRRADPSLAYPRLAVPILAKASTWLSAVGDVGIPILPIGARRRAEWWRVTDRTR